jgi:hypothetical protein
VTQTKWPPANPERFTPDEFDALILTWAHPVMVPDFRPRPRMAVEYNPFAETDANRASNFAYDYNPFAEPWLN